MSEEYEALEELSAEAEIVERVKKRWREARQHSKNWRSDAREDFDFVSGSQWTEDDRQMLADQLRPVVTFNRVGPVVDVVTGTEVQNRQEVRYVPREAGDSKANELLTGAAQWARDLCDAEDEDSDAFHDVVVCGMGWTETRMDYEMDPEGRIVIERVDPMEMYWDGTARKRNISDARWVLRVEEMERDELRDLWPDKYMDVVGATALWGDDLEDESPHVTVAGDQYANGDQTDAKRKQMVKVVEYQWWERVDMYRVADPMTGSAAMLDKAKFERLSANFARHGMELRYVKQKRREYKRAFIAGDVLLEEGGNPDPNGFTYKCITGKRDRNTNTWYGLVRAMKDPQRWANKWLSQTMHIINSNSKGGLLAEEDAFKNPRKAESEWSDPSSITMLKSGALSQGKVQEKSALTYPAGLDRLMEFAVSSIRDVTGVNVEMLGMSEGNQPGILDFQRKQAGITILGTMFDSLRRYRKEQGRLLLHFIREYISDGRLVKIAGAQGEAYVPLMRQSSDSYDVIVDDAPTSPNQKEMVFATLSQMLPQLLQAGIPIPPEIVDYAPLPTGLIEKWKELLSKQGGPTPEEVEMLKLQLAEAMADNQKLRTSEESKVQKVMLDAKIKQEQMALDRQLQQEEMAFKEAQAQREYQYKLQLAQAESELDAAKAGAKIDSDADAAQAKMEIEARIQSMRLEFDRERAAMEAAWKDEQAQRELEMKERIARLEIDLKRDTAAQESEIRTRETESTHERETKMIETRHAQAAKIPPAEVNVEVGSELVTAFEGIADKFSQSTDAVVKAVENMNRPKEIVFEDGKPVGIRPSK
tara:strand:- start:1384 stop:3834 length:2451 start_codon:yes stop_codon:yes gene_type:complete